MTAMQFDAEIREGVLTLPPVAKGTFDGPVHVIIVKEDAETGDDFIAELLASPVSVPGFVPLSRNDANKRGS